MAKKLINKNEHAALYVPEGFGLQGFETLEEVAQAGVDSGTLIYVYELKATKMFSYQPRLE